MPRRLLPILLGLLLGAPGGRAEPVRAEFGGAASVFQWPLARLNADLPADWTGYEFLVLELRADASQRFELGLFTDQGLLTKRLQLFSNGWTRVAVPLRFFRDPPGDGPDLAATMNQPRPAFWTSLESGGHGPLTAVTALAVFQSDPVGRPTVEIRAVSLAKTDPGDAVLEGKPLVDEFGQSSHANWQGKATTLEDLKRAWSREATAPAPALPDRCPYGGFTGTQAKATGFFHVEQIDGRWWLVCPEGHLFFSTGVNGTGPAASTPVAGREDWFAALPPGAPAVAGAPAPRAATTASFYTWNLQRRFGDDWRTEWAGLTVRRLQAWGFNTVYAGRDPELTAAQPRLPYVIMLRDWRTGPAIMGLPDVDADDFALRMDAAAARLVTAHRDDPWLLGYFIGDEPPWPGRESQLVDLILAGPANGLRRELADWLEAGDTPARRQDFVLRAYAHYLAVVNTALAKYDPNHLNLGIRFGGRPPDEVIRLARVFDVYSQDLGGAEPDPAFLDKCYALTARPILLGAFGFGAPERGLAPGPVQVANQAERGAAYRYYVEHAAAHPVVIGAHWSQWVDDPATGRADGENFNTGLVDVTDRPYAELVTAAQATHARLYDIHTGKTPPVETKARAN